MNDKHGFTLAEILIALGIIGVVAAMTMATIINKVQKYQLEIAFKQSYSIISNAINMYYADNGEAMIPKNINPQSVGNIFKKYIRKAEEIDKTRIKYKNYPNNLTWHSNFYTKSTYNYIMNNGSFLYISMDYGDKNKLFITVDINGYKSPNRLGYDVFVFYIDNEGKLQPMGTEGSAMKICDKDNYSDGNGAGCTIKALNDKHYFKNLPKF